MQWKQLYDTPYNISDTGIVVNTRTNKHLKPKNRSYPTVGISVQGNYREIALHRAVAEHFIPNPDNLQVVRHKDNNKQNYSVDNLCWGTYSDNLQDAISAGANCVGKKVVRLKDGEVVEIHRSLSATASAIGLANPSTGGASHIKNACEGRVKSLKGFTFRYAKEGDEN